MTEVQTPTALVVERGRKPRKPARHYLEEHPPPPMEVLTIDQVEAKNEGLRGRLRQWVKKADAGDPDYRWLTLCILRVAGSVFIDDVRFRDQLHQRTAMPPRARKCKPETSSASPKRPPSLAE